MMGIFFLKLRFGYKLLLRHIDVIVKFHYFYSQKNKLNKLTVTSADTYIMPAIGLSLQPQSQKNLENKGKCFQQPLFTEI